MGRPLPACPPPARADGYARRQPEHTVLHRALREHWPAFVEHAEQAGGLPQFVTREVSEYLRCGLLEHGCALLACERCGSSMLVAFSCKRRGFCPSCCGRRMSDAALHLTTRGLPEVPVRQWVCTLPWQLRYLLGYERALCAAVLNAFVAELSRSYVRRAKREHGVRSVGLLHTGSVTFVQRTDSALRLNVHAHTIALDGVYLQGDSSGALKFLPLPEPSPADVQQLAERSAARIERLLRKSGRYLEDHAEPAAEPEDTLAREQPALSACYQAAAGDRLLFGEHAGKPALRLLHGEQAGPRSAPKLCAQVRGVNVHASAAVPGTDRPRIERLCRYAARPPLSQERLQALPDGRLRLELKKPWANGTKAVVLEPLDFIARLVAAIPPPRFHMTRFHGVLAPHCNLRAQVVPKPEQPRSEPPLQLPLFQMSVPIELAARTRGPRHREPRVPSRHPWALLLRHVFTADVTRCPLAHCQGRMRLVELCTTPKAIARAMARAGLAPQPPPELPTRRARTAQLALPMG